MICWPTRVEIQVWATPRTEVATATPSIAATAQASSVTSCCGMASSITSFTRNGLANAMSEDATMSTSTTDIDQRCGWNRAAMRRSGTGESASWRLSAGSIVRPLPRAALRPPGPGRKDSSIRTSFQKFCEVTSQ